MAIIPFPPSSFTNRSANPYPFTPQDQRSTEAFLLALLTAGGGLTGYIRTGSIPSVVAGTGVGALYALGGYRLRQRQPYGAEIALAASLVLAGSSVPRAIRSGKILPAGLSLLATLGIWRFGGLVWSSRA